MAAVVLPSFASGKFGSLSVSTAFLRPPLLALLVAALPLRVTSDCSDRHSTQECQRWARSGECDKNPSYMLKECAKSCDACDQQDMCTKRGPPALQSGQLKKLFKRASEMSELKPTVLSRNPWILTFENFVTPEESKVFLSLAEGKYFRSLAGDVKSEGRTSSQFWCTPPCEQDAVVERVHQRIVNLTGIPRENAEHFQILEYKEGQSYKQHHDQNFDHDTACGVRLATFFIVLDAPEEGGATTFPELGIEVTPRPGLAIFWPNVLNLHLTTSDMRTVHQALPPLKGIKHSVNLWLHQYNFRTPWERGCDLKLEAREDFTEDERHAEL